MHAYIIKLDPKCTQFSKPELYKSQTQYRHCDYIWYSGTQYLWAISFMSPFRRPEF